MSEPGSFFEEIGASEPQWEVLPADAIHRPLPAIPEPSTTPRTRPCLTRLRGGRGPVAEQCEDVEEVREVYDRMAAVAAYLARQDHAAAAAAALRSAGGADRRAVAPARGRARRRIIHCCAREHQVLQQADEFRQMARTPRGRGRGDRGLLRGVARLSPQGAGCHQEPRRRGQGRDEARHPSLGGIHSSPGL